MKILTFEGDRLSQKILSNDSIHSLETSDIMIVVEFAATLSENKNKPPTMRFVLHHNIGNARCVFTQAHVNLTHPQWLR